MQKRKLKQIEISERPELLALVEEVERSGGIVELVCNGEKVLDVRTAFPAKAAPRRRKRTGIITLDDPLWKLVGAATDAPPTDSSRKYDYLAEKKP